MGETVPTQLPFQTIIVSLQSPVVVAVELLDPWSSNASWDPWSSSVSLFVKQGDYYNCLVWFVFWGSCKYSCVSVMTLKNVTVFTHTLNEKVKIHQKKNQTTLIYLENFQW